MINNDFADLFKILLKHYLNQVSFDNDFGIDFVFTNYWKMGYEFLEFVSGTYKLLWDGPRFLGLIVSKGILGEFCVRMI